jgi:hypothetical protein
MYDYEKCKSKILNFSVTLASLFIGTTEATQKHDFVLLKKLNEQLVAEIESTIIENENFKVSKNFEEIHNEWESTLNSYHSAAMLGIEIADLFQKGQFDDELIQKHKHYTEQGNMHLKKVSSLIL